MAAQTTVIEVLRTMLPSSLFTGEEMDAVAGLCALRVMQRGEVLMAEGEPFDDRVYFIVRGSVSVYMQDKFILRLSQPGDSIGEMGLISNAPRSATVRVEVETELLVLDTSVVGDREPDQNYKFRYFLSRIFNSILTRKLRTTSEVARKYEDMAAHSQEMEEQRATLEQEISSYLDQINMFNHLVSSASEAILVTDTGGRVLNANPATLNEFGMAPSGLLGVEMVTLIVLQDGRECDWKDITAAARSGGWAREVSFRHGESRAIPAECTVSAVQGSEGDLLAYSVFLRNITQRKALEAKALQQQRELEYAYQQLKELDKAKRSFLNLISHELRTPLTSILGSAELLLMEGMVEPQDQGMFMETIFREATKLNEMVAKVLAIAKMEGGEMLLNFEEQQLEETARQAVDLSRERAMEKGLEITFEAAEGLPPISFDHTNITEALTQLLENAIKFTKAGKIAVSVERGEGGVMVHVDDTGPGLGGKNLEDLLSAFGKGDMENIAAHGLGLGLPLCYLIVKAHSGELRYSVSGLGGTRATLTLQPLSVTT